MALSPWRSCRRRFAEFGLLFRNDMLTTMAVDKLVLDLTLVLPHVPDKRDACVGRLISQLKSKDIDQVHVVREDGQVRLCLDAMIAADGIRPRRSQG